jgi:hypothetical protein
VTLSHVAVTTYPEPPAPASEIHRVAAALQTQVLRDVRPLWDVEATVDVFESLHEVPTGWSTLVLVDREFPRRGLHFSSNGQPLAFVKHSDSWSLPASHELIEMLVDPAGNQIRSGRSLMEDQGQVDFLVEVCDPVQAPDNAYIIGGVLVSDFVTPSYYDPRDTRGARYSFSGKIQEPRTVLPGGYLSWRDPESGDFWQGIGSGTTLSGDGEALDFNCLGKGDFSDLSMRAWVDARTDDRTAQRQVADGLPSHHPVLQAAQLRWKAAGESAQAHGHQLREDIERLRHGWRVLVGGPESFQVTALIDDVAGLLKTVNSDEFREAFDKDPWSALRRLGIELTEGTHREETTLPTKENVYRALRELKESDTDPSRTFLRNFVVEMFGGY